MTIDTDLEQDLANGWDEATEAARKRLDERRKTSLLQVFEIDDDVDEAALAIPGCWTDRDDDKPWERPQIAIVELRSREAISGRSAYQLQRLARRLADDAIDREDDHLLAMLQPHRVGTALKMTDVRAAPSTALPEVLNRVPHALVLTRTLWCGSTVAVDKQTARKETILEALQGPIIENVGTHDAGLLIPMKRWVVHRAHDFQLHRPETDELALTAALAVSAPAGQRVLRLLS